jgi:hypothetical protein
LRRFFDLRANIGWNGDQISLRDKTANLIQVARHVSDELVRLRMVFLDFFEDLDRRMIWIDLFGSVREDLLFFF